MATDNHTTIVGNLVDDPELRFTSSGIAVANLRVAVTQRIQQDGQWRDGDTSFLRVNVWRGQAENLADSLAKGHRVMVTGRLRQRSWETLEGEKRSVAEIEADEVGASLKWATAKVERASQRGNGDRTQGRERRADRGGGAVSAEVFGVALTRSSNRAGGFSAVPRPSGIGQPPPARPSRGEEVPIP